MVGNRRMKVDNKGFSLLELLIALGLTMIIVFTIATLSLSFNRYQARRLERAHVQENFRNTVSIISEELKGVMFLNLLEPPLEGMSLELFFTYDGRDIIRYSIERSGVESQVFRTRYNSATPINRTNWSQQKSNILSQVPLEKEPVSDRIRAISHFFFTFREGLTVSILGQLANGLRVNYISLVFPRN